MIKGLMLASYSGAVGDILNQWESIGVFSLILPFLLIFAVVFGILSVTNFFNGNKSIDAIIAFVVGLMAIQFSFVSDFFREIFPRLGVGLVIILVILIGLGLFYKPGEKDSAAVLKWIMVGVSSVIVIVILIQSGGALGWSSGTWFYDNWSNLLILLVVGGLIATIIATSTKSGSSSSGK